MIACGDAAGLETAQKSYGDSWKKRGGVGAFMMLARKWDRIEKALDPSKEPGDQREAPMSARCGSPVPAFDIFVGIAADNRAEGLIDDIRDLRRYLLLVEAEMRARGAVSATSTHRDNASRDSTVAITVLQELRDLIKNRLDQSTKAPFEFIPRLDTPDEGDACEALVTAGWMKKVLPNGYVFTEESK